MKNPFLIEGPAVIQVSGGRTSGYMLWRILDAHSGRLPSDVHVSFQNTGLEHPATYRFVERMAIEWDVPITWLEWRPSSVRAHPEAHRGFEIVGPNNADRDGHWFAELIRQKQFLPNSTMRFCSTELKVRACKRWMKSLGYRHWTSVIGIRADEPHRVARGRARNDGGKEMWDSVWPLHVADVTEPKVLKWWKDQFFDLELPSRAFGNCILCHLKSRVKLLEVMLSDIEIATWQVTMEDAVTSIVAARSNKTNPGGMLFGTEEIHLSVTPARFRNDGWTYRQMRDFVRDHRAAAQAEVDRYKRETENSGAQSDLLDSCMCGVG